MSVNRWLAAAWSYRGFIRSSIVNDFRTRFARSRLGTLWLLLQPLAQALIFTVVLANVLAARMNGINNRYGYALYVMAGLLCWTLFSEIVTRCLTMFVDNANLLRKMRFPRVALPAIVVGSALVTNAALAGVVVVLAPSLGFPLGAHLLWLPVLCVVTAILALGIGLLLGVVNVFARDAGQVTNVVLQFWYWSTPIVYPATIVPAGMKQVLRFNPLTALVESYQSVVVFGRAPSVGLVWTAALGIALLVIAAHVFRRAAPELVDVL